MLDDLANYCASNGLGTIGVNIFELYLPDQANNAIMIKETGGPILDPSSKYLPFKTPTFQVITRNSSETVGIAQALVVRNLFHRLVNTTIGSTYFYYILMVQEPQGIGMDNNGRYEWSQNFLCQTR